MRALPRYFARKRTTLSKFLDLPLKPMRELRCALESVDSGCPNQHYTKYVDTLQHTVQLKGHPLVCSNDGGCHSQLQIIRSAATHYPVLVTLSHHVYQAIGAHAGEAAY